MIKKLLALTLCFSVLNSPLLWAAVPNAAALPANKSDGQEVASQQSLAAYQQQAKEDLARAPWIAREGKYILGIGGTSVALLIAQHIIHQRKTYALRSEYMASIKAARQTGQQRLLSAQKEWDLARKDIVERFETRIAEMDKEMAALLNEKKALQEELRITKIKKDGLAQSAATQRSKRLAAEQAAAEREAALTAQLDALQERFDRKKLHYTDLTHYSPSLDKELVVYEKLFDKSVPEAERLALRKQLEKEPWLLKTTEAQQKEFLKLIDEASAYRRGTYRDAGDGFMRFLIRKAIDRNMPLYERMIGMCRHIFHSKNLMAIAVVAALGISAQDVKAQKMADRVNTNFDLFLNATPQQLAEMEKDETVRAVCIQGAQALHLMSQMSAEEAAFITEGLQTTPAASALEQIRSTTKHLSR